MTLEILLLALESVLLIFTIALLVLSIREGRGRDALIEQVSSAMRMLTRHEYFITVVDAMMDAREELVASITGRMPATADDDKRVRELALAIEKLRSQGVRVRYLMPKFQDRLYLGWLYTKAGAEVRYSSCPVSHGFRYTVVDAKLVVVGIPEEVGEREATRKGDRIPSPELAEILRRDFYDCWESQATYEQFLRETVAQTGASPKTLSRELRIDEADLEACAARREP